MAVHLVRHGSAGTRRSDDPADTARHLDPRGRSQAEALADLLEARPVVWVASSPADRCVETVAPLAARLGQPVAVVADLLEGADVDDAWDVLAEAASLDGDAVLCSHGDVIPDLIRRLQLRGMEVPGKAGCSKGSCWTLTGWDGERFARGDYTSVTSTAT